MRQIIQTRPVAEVQRMTEAIMESRETGAIGQIIGESGTGKSQAGHFVVRQQDKAARLCCHQGISNKAMMGLLFEALGEDQPPGSVATLLQRVRPLVDGVLLVVDEANHLRWQQLEALRYLADEGGMGLLLIGTELLERPFRDGRTAVYLAQLASRIGAKRVRFEPITDLKEFAGYVIQPRFGNVDRATAQTFFEVSKGYWRDAAELANACERVMQAQSLAKLTPAVVAAAAAWMAPARKVA